MELELINSSYVVEYKAYLKTASVGGLSLYGSFSIKRGLLTQILGGFFESTGAFLTAEKAQSHLKAESKKVVFPAPAKDDLHSTEVRVDPGIFIEACEA